MNGYELSRAWFDWCFENPEKVNPNHTAIFFFAIEHCNRLGWRDKFGFPSQMTMDAIGIKKHQTYIKYFNDLVEWGFFKLIQKSQNQYSSNIISLVCDLPKNGKALDKAIINHAAKHIETNGQSNSSVDKPINKETNKQRNKEERAKAFKLSILKFQENYQVETLKAFYEYWTESGEKDLKMRYEKEKVFDIGKRLKRWVSNEKQFSPEKQAIKLRLVD